MKQVVNDEYISTNSRIERVDSFLLVWFTASVLGECVSIQAVLMNFTEVCNSWSPVFIFDKTGESGTPEQTDVASAVATRSREELRLLQKQEQIRCACCEGS